MFLYLIFIIYCYLLLHFKILFISLMAFLESCYSIAKAYNFLIHSKLTQMWKFLFIFSWEGYVFSKIYNIKCLQPIQNIY